MVNIDQPLLARDRPPSERSDDRAEEEDNLLTGQPNKPQQSERYGWAFWRQVGVFTWAVVATAVVIVLAVTLQHQRTISPQPAEDASATKPNGKRNLIFMVSDGMGPTSLSLTRSFRKVTQGEVGGTEALTLDPHLIGSSRTRSASSFITDSAAGATAFSCGFKSYNGAISMLPDGTPCGTVLEAAKKAGYMTGLVVTTRITDATPACFAAHVNQRGEEDSIAEQLVGQHPLGRVVDLILGGGRCHFLPNTTDGSCRGDDTDVISLAQKNGFSYIASRAEFDNLDAGAAVNLPLLGLFASHDIPYEIDRRFQDEQYPSLDEMARTAMQALKVATEDTEQGFFLMIEGSRIDHAGHANDPAAQVHEVLAYDKAFASVLKFLDDPSVPGVAVSTSDHETGGLAVARQLHYDYPEYLWHPAALANASASNEALTAQLTAFDQTQPSETARRSKVASLISEGLGVLDYSDWEIDAIVKARDYLHASYGFSDIISRRAQNGWSTHGHSAADVNIYASDPGQTGALRGNHENTEVGNFLRDYLDLDLEPISKQLREADFYKGASLHLGRPLDLPLDHYEGDFKKRGLADCGCGGSH